MSAKSTKRLVWIGLAFLLSGAILFGTSFSLSLMGNNPAFIVKDQITGKPIEGAMVQAGNIIGYVHVTQANPSGQVQLALSAGIWHVTISASGYKTATLTYNTERPFSQESNIHVVELQQPSVDEVITPPSETTPPPTEQPSTQVPVDQSVSQQIAVTNEKLRYSAGLTLMAIGLFILVPIGLKRKH